MYQENICKYLVGNAGKLKDIVFLDLKCSQNTFKRCLLQ